LDFLFLPFVPPLPCLLFPARGFFVAFSRFAQIKRARHLFYAKQNGAYGAEDLKPEREANNLGI